jgi:hypothetical protein
MRRCKTEQSRRNEKHQLTMFLNEVIDVVEFAVKGFMGEFILT